MEVIAAMAIELKEIMSPFKILELDGVTKCDRFSLWGYRNDRYNNNVYYLMHFNSDLYTLEATQILEKDMILDYIFYFLDQKTDNDDQYGFTKKLFDSIKKMTTDYYVRKFTFSSLPLSFQLLFINYPKIWKDAAAPEMFINDLFVKLFRVSLKPSHLDRQVTISLLPNNSIIDLIDK